LVSSTANISFLLFAVSLFIIYMMVSRCAQLQWIGMAAVVFLFVDLYVFGANQNNSPNSPEEYFKRAAPVVDFVKQQNEIFRLNMRNADGLVVDRNQGMVDRIFMKEGYTPLVLQRREMPVAVEREQFDLLNIKYMTVTDSQRQGLQLALNPTYLPRAIMMPALHVARTEQEITDSLRSPTFDYRTVAIIEKEPPFPLSPQAAPGKATITEYKNNSISLSTASEGNGFLMLSEIFYPGWNAYIDGSEVEVYRTDYCLRGVFVPAGNHTIVFRFESAPFAKGACATLATLLVCIGGIVYPRFRKAPSTTQMIS
ncbi:MAG: YfhO family protein, partial [bacterium]